MYKSYPQTYPQVCISSGFHFGTLRAVVSGEVIMKQAKQVLFETYTELLKHWTHIRTCCPHLTPKELETLDKSIERMKKLVEEWKESSDEQPN